MKRSLDTEDASFNLDSMINELLDRLDDALPEQDVELPEVEVLADRYSWVRAWGPPTH
jgi:hypothetical protein